MANDGTVRIGTEIDDSGFKSGISKLGSVASTGMKAATGAIAAASTSVLAFGASSVKVGMDFDKSMSQVAATMGTTTDKVQNLRDFALEMGSKTSFSATEAADALNYMALAGYTADESMQQLPNVLNLAAAGGIDLAYASDMVTDAQSALGLTMDESAQLVDKMAMASSKSNTSIAQLGAAILQVGGTAKVLKGGTTELATVLGILADNGVKGAEGGTALRNIILSLSAPTNKAADAIDSLGLKVFDSSGNMRSLNDIFMDMDKSLSKLSQEKKTQVLNEIFNKVDLKSVNAMLANSGKRFDELSGYIDKAQGSAEAMAETQLDNLAGDITLFESAMQTAQIAISDKLTPALRDFVQFGTSGVSKLTDTFKNEGLSGAVDALGNILADALARLAEGLPGFIQLGFDIIESIINGLLDAAPRIGEAALPIIEALVKGYLSYYTLLLDSAAKIIKQLAQGLQQALPELVPAAVETITQFANDLIGSASELLGAALQLIVVLADGLVAALPELSAAIPEIITNIVTTLSDHLPEILEAGKNILISLAEGLLSAIPELLAGLPAVIESIISFVIDSLPQIIQTGVELLLGLLAGIIKAIPELVGGLVEVIESINQKFMETDWIQLGKDILGGIAKGIKNAIGSVVDAAKEAGQAVLNKFKSFFKIHSPSHVTRDQIGVMLNKGVAVGIVKTKDAIKAVEKMSKETLEKAKKTLGINKDASSEFREQVGAKIVAGTAQGIKKNSKKAEKAAQETSQKILQAATQWISDKKKYFDMSLEEEAEFWEDLKSMTGLKAAEIEQIERNLYVARQEARLADAEAQKKAFEQADKAADDYLRNIESRANALQNFVGLFDEVGKSSELTADELTKRLEEQVLQLERYQNDMALLAQRGVPQALLDTLKGLGPKAAHEIRVLSQMSSVELQNYVELFAKKTRLAVEQAQREVGAFEIPVTVKELTPEQVRLIYQNLNKSLSELASSGEAFVDGIAQSAEKNMGLIGAVASNTVKEYVKSIDNQLGIVKNTGVAMVKTLQGALTGNKNLVQSAAKDLATAFTGEATKAEGESRRIGNNLVSNMVDGIENGKGSLFSAVSRMVSDALQKADEEIRRKSKGSSGSSERSTYSTDVATFAARMAPRMPEVQASFVSAASSFTPSAVSHNVTNNNSERTIVNKIEMPVTVYGATGSRQESRNIGREIGQQAAYEMRRRGLKV